MTSEQYAECEGYDSVGPYHLWTCDGPFNVTCDRCGAEGRITVTEPPYGDDDR